MRLLIYIKGSELSSSTFIRSDLVSFYLIIFIYNAARGIQDGGASGILP